MDDGLGTGRMVQKTTRCDICDRWGCVVRVEAYTGVDQDWRATIIWIGRPDQECAVFLGVSCECLQKLHRHVAHIRDKQKARNRRSDPAGARN